MPFSIHQFIVTKNGSDLLRYHFEFRALYGSSELRYLGFKYCQNLMLLRYVIVQVKCNLFTIDHYAVTYSVPAIVHRRNAV